MDPYLHAKYLKKLMSQFQKNCVTDGRTHVMIVKRFVKRFGREQAMVIIIKIDPKAREGGVTSIES